MQCLWIDFLFQRFIRSTLKILPCDCKNMCEYVHISQYGISQHPHDRLPCGCNYPDPFVPDLSTSIPYHDCHFCDEMFASNSSFSRHMLEFHSDRALLSCNSCKNIHKQVTDTDHHVKSIMYLRYTSTVEFFRENIKTPT